MPRVPLLAACAAFAACALDPVVQTHVVHQAALVPAPRGPHAQGPLLDDGQKSLSGAFTASVRPAPARETLDGNVPPRHGGRGRIDFGVGPAADVGFEVEYHTDRASALDAVGSGAAPGSLWIGGGGRKLLSGDRRIGLGVLGDLSLGTIPYRRTVTTTTIREGSPTDTRSSVTSGHELAAILRAGLFGVVTAGPVSFMTGTVVQNQPLFFADATVTESCDLAGESTPCGQALEDLDASEATLAVIPFLSGALSLGERVSIVGQLSATSLGKERVKLAAPVEGDVVVRVRL